MEDYQDREDITVVDESSFEAFNALGEYFKEKDCTIRYFTRKYLNNREILDAFSLARQEGREFDMEKEMDKYMVDIDCIHIYKDDYMLLSGFFDPGSVINIAETLPHVEYYDGENVYRFPLVRRDFLKMSTVLFEGLLENHNKIKAEKDKE